MEQKTITPKELKAMEKVKRANAELAKVRREQKKQLRKEQDHHKNMMGGVIVKYLLKSLRAGIMPAHFSSYSTSPKLKPTV